MTEAEAYLATMGRGVLSAFFGAIIMRIMLGMFARYGWRDIRLYGPALCMLDAALRLVGVGIGTASDATISYARATLPGFIADGVAWFFGGFKTLADGMLWIEGFYFSRILVPARDILIYFAVIAAVVYLISRALNLTFLIPYATQAMVAGIFYALPLVLYLHALLPLLNEFLGWVSKT